MDDTQEGIEESLFDDLDLSRKPKKLKEEELQFNIAIVTSKEDPASMNIRQHLLKGKFKAQKLKFDNNPLYNAEHLWILTLEGSMLHYEHLDQKIDADLFIFASRHQSKEGKPCFTLHAPGNFGKAEYGGNPHEVSLSSAVYNKIGIKVLAEHAGRASQEVSLEATHHGPLLIKRPCFFIEIGSTEKEWSDPSLGSLMAECILEICKRIQRIELGKETKPAWKIALGIGGPHYCPAFTKLQAGGTIAISHICAKYNLGTFSKEMLEHALAKTIEPVDFVLIDRNGLGEHKQKVMEILHSSGIDVKHTDEV